MQWAFEKRKDQKKHKPRRSRKRGSFERGTEKELVFQGVIITTKDYGTA